MLAECGIVENLTESLRQQSLEDFRDLEVLESLAHCGKRVDISPNFSRRKDSFPSIILESERPQNYHKDRATSRDKSSLLVNQKNLETSKDTDLKLQSTLPEMLKSKIIPEKHLDVDSNRGMLSSSEEELSELYGKNKVYVPSNGNIQYLMAPSCQFGAKVSDEDQSSGTSDHDCCSCQNQKDIYFNRKRFKEQPKGKTKIVKKIKLSRPSLDLDKMQATRMRCDKKFFLKNGNIFAPIDAT